MTKVLRYVVHKSLNILTTQNGKLCLLCVTISTLITMLLLWIKIELMNTNKKTTIHLYIPVYKQPDFNGLPLSGKLQTIFKPVNTPSYSDLSFRFNNKRTTKSISEMLKSVPELNDDVIFFNRIPRSGSEVLVLLLHWLSNHNGFRHVQMPGGSRHCLDRHDQEKVVESVRNEIMGGALPCTFDLQMFFINFTSFGQQSPTYVNLIRDPIDKAISRYFYHTTKLPITKNVTRTIVPSGGSTKPNNHINKTLTKLFSTSIHRKVNTTPKMRYSDIKKFEKCVLKHDPRCVYFDGYMYDLSIPYFCGHEEWCMMLNDEWALRQAKQNVDRYYSAVGVLEELNKTLIVLEHQMPFFFSNIVKLFHFNLEVKRRENIMFRPIMLLTDKVRLKLEKMLSKEYEFYYFVKKKLLAQYAIAAMHNNLL